MSRHFSKKEKVQDLLNDIQTSINRTNVDLALPILEWTFQKIALAHNEKIRAKHYVSSGKKLSPPRFVTRGKVYYAYLGRNIGSEQNGYRPVLVVQNKKANSTSPTVIIVPLTDLLDRHGNPKRLQPTHAVIRHPQLKKPSIAKTEFVRSISKNRLLDEICLIDPDTLAEVEEKMKIALQLT